MRGVILYGPPASGKDAVTAALTALDPTYQHFYRLKAGTGRTSGYRLTSAESIETLRARGDVLWENSQYGALYVVDRPALCANLFYCVPVVHVGQLDAVTAISSAVPDAHWAVVHLWCPRPIAEQRLAARGDGVDVSERLRVWDATPPLTGASVLRIDTAHGTPADAALLIHAHAFASPGPVASH